jgi:hypothetical protein
MSNLVHNERVTFAATFFNNIGVAPFAVGGMLPLLNGALEWPTSMVGVVICFAFGFIGMTAAYNMLGTLKE